jgi:hypothetical protein
LLLETLKFALPVTGDETMQRSLPWIFENFSAANLNLLMTPMGASSVFKNSSKTPDGSPLKAEDDAAADTSAPGKRRRKSANAAEKAGGKYMKALRSKVRQIDDREVLWVEDLVDSVQYAVENRSCALPTHTEQQAKSTVYGWALEFAFAGKVSVNAGEYEAWSKLRATLQGVVGRASSGQVS